MDRILGRLKDGDFVGLDAKGALFAAAHGKRLDLGSHYLRAIREEQTTMWFFVVGGFVPYSSSPKQNEQP
jgi:hypothetical protein